MYFCTEKLASLVFLISLKFLNQPLHIFCAGIGTLYVAQCNLGSHTQTKPCRDSFCLPVCTIKCPNHSWVLGVMSALQPFAWNACVWSWTHPKCKSFFQKRKIFLQELMLDNGDRNPTVRFFEKVLGLMVASFVAVPFAQFNKELSNKTFLLAWKKAGSFPSMVPSSQAITSLSWWITT